MVGWRIPPEFSARIFCMADKADCEQIPNVIFKPFVCGALGGFGDCATEAWSMLMDRATKLGERSWLHSWTSMTFSTFWLQKLSVALFNATAQGIEARLKLASRQQVFGLESEEGDSRGVRAGVWGEED